MFDNYFVLLVLNVLVINFLITAGEISCPTSQNLNQFLPLIIHPPTTSFQQFQMNIYIFFFFFFFFFFNFDLFFHKYLSGNFDFKMPYFLTGTRNSSMGLPSGVSLMTCHIIRGCSTTELYILIQRNHESWIWRNYWSSLYSLITHPELWSISKWKQKSFFTWDSREPRLARISSKTGISKGTRISLGTRQSLQSRLSRDAGFTFYSRKSW